MDGRVILRRGIGFYIEITVWALLKSLYEIHVLWVYQFGYTRNIDPAHAAV